MPVLSPGVLPMLWAVLCFALMNVGVKWVPRLPVHEVVFFRALTTLVIGYLALRRRRIHPWGRHKPLLLARGAFGTAALLLYFYTLQTMPLASAVTVQHLSPIFTILLAGPLLAEPPRPVQGLYFLIAFAGVVLVKGFDPRVTLLELSLGIAAAALSATAYTLVRKLKATDHPLVVVFYFPLVTVPLVGPYTALNWVSPTAVEWAALLFVGLSTTAAQIGLTVAYQRDRAANISSLNYLGVPLALGLGWALFNETIPGLGLLGVGLIVGGVLLATRAGSRP